jgi:GGDEF domain-containing protein
LVELDGFENLPVHARERWGKLLVQAASAEIPADAELIRVSASQRAVVLPDFERRQAVTLASNIITRLERLYNRQPEGELPSATVSAGIATATSIFKNFSAMLLVEGAQRSLSAARASGGSSVKSIEVL